MKTSKAVAWSQFKALLMRAALNCKHVLVIFYMLDLKTHNGERRVVQEPVMLLNIYPMHIQYIDQVFNTRRNNNVLRCNVVRM